MVEARLAIIIETVEARMEAMMHRMIADMLRQGQQPSAMDPSIQLLINARPSDTVDEDEDVDANLGDG